MKKSEVSNQQILQAIQGLDKKVGGLDKKVGGLDQKFASLDQKVSRNTKDIDKILSALHDFSINTEQRFDAVDSRLNIVEHNQEDILSNLSNVAYKFEIRDLEKRVGVLEKS